MNATDWQVHGMSVEGYRHRRADMPCQDWCGHGRVGPVTVLAVADGAGSRPRSDEGSRLAVQLAVDHIGHRAAALADRDATEARDPLRATFLKVREEFKAETGPDCADFATTLTVVVLAPGWLMYLTVGDGFVVLRSGTEDGVRQYHLLPQPEAVSEYSNETVFLTSEEAPTRMIALPVYDPWVDGVLLSTDGLAQAALGRSGGEGPVNASFAEAVLRSLDAPGPVSDSAHEGLATLLRSDRLTALNADDKTLLRAVRRRRS